MNNIQFIFIYMCIYVSTGVPFWVIIVIIKHNELDYEKIGGCPNPLVCFM